MKYNFDTVHDRVNDPHSYSLKYQIYLEYSDGMSPGVGYHEGAVPEDSIALYHADMDFDMAPEIVEECHKAADFPNYGYSAPRRSYYEAVQRWFHVRFGWDFAPEDVYECNGTHAGVGEAIATFTNPGAGVILFIPSYPFRHDIEPNGRKYVPIDFLRENGRYSIDWEAFEKAAKDPANEALILVQPHNPLGFVYTVEEMQRMAAICRANGMIMIADMVHLDIYRKGVNPFPLAKAVGPEGVVSLTGLAKTFNISGLCMSNMIVSDPKLKAKLGFRYAALTPFGIAAATAAYTKCDEWVDQLNDYIDGLCRYTCDFLAKNMPKVQFVVPEASYVLYLDFSGYGLTSDELDERIAKKAHVLLSNGRMFSGENAQLNRRLCLTAPMDTIQEALNRLKDAFADLA